VGLGQKRDILQWVGSHKNNALTLKRYLPHQAMEHPGGLSQNTWQQVQTMAWSPDHAQTLEQELAGCYQRGEWYGEVGTQFNKTLFEREKLIENLGLDPAKKTAILFAHMFWDASFFYGIDLFADYQAWFVETIRAAIHNPHLNWLIKIHPANTVKNQREGIQGELAEMRVIREHIGVLPPHIKLIPAESAINTFSLFGLMDYCLTVRGTVGIEAASFGIPVITAGTGRFSGRGFTLDSNSPAEYLEKLAHLHTLPPLTPAQRELAQRFAYASFLMRPFILRSVQLAFQQDAIASARVQVNASTLRDLLGHQDTLAFQAWVQSGQCDYMESI
jgi:hypothetical protein